MTTMVDRNVVIKNLVSELARMRKAPCPSCDEAYVFTGETDLCPSGAGIHVRLDEARQHFSGLAAD